MGTYLNYHIEYREKNGEKWQLVSMMVPKEKHSFPEHTQRKTVDGAEYCISNEDSIQGHVRDLFFVNGWYGAKFTGRGLPSDISDELKDYLNDRAMEAFEEQKKSMDPEMKYEIDNGVLKHVKRTEPISFEKDYQDYTYDKTWVTLSELSAFQKEQLKEASDRLKETKDKDLFEKISDRLDSIEAFIKGGKPSETEREEPDGEEEAYWEIEELEDEVDDAVSLGEWIRGINEIVDFYTGGWHDYEDIRLVCYLS